eukprot:m.17781 g.17781  ORF g.17781 m.17781 type:complete len:280 (-) comp11673_c0_seq1:123-962(-)
MTNSKFKQFVARLTPVNVVFELFVTVGVMTISWSYAYAGMWGFCLHTLFVGWVSIIADWFVSNTMKDNLADLKLFGYEPHWMWLLMFVNLVGSNCLVCVICNGFGCFEVEPRFDLHVIGGLVLNFVMAECTFTGAHFWLHRSKVAAEYHCLHHCCKPCSWSTNVLFHPVDLAIEFSGPFIGLVAMHLFVLQDAFVLLLSVHLLHLWYALDHSELLQLFHYQHHVSVDSVYSIYVKLRFGNTTPDQVKPLLKRINDSENNENNENKRKRMKTSTHACKQM